MDRRERRWNSGRPWWQRALRTAALFVLAVPAAVIVWAKDRGTAPTPGH